VKGLITSDLSQGGLNLEIPKKDTIFGQQAGGEWGFFDDPPAVPTLKLSWDRRHMTWRANRITPKISIGGIDLPTEGTRLSDNTQIQVGDWIFQFQKLINPPILEGNPVSDRINLKSASKLTIGRDLGKNEADKLCLDADDLMISKEHLVLQKNSEGWHATDKSKTGTDLNGRLFGQTRLVYGDRLRISNYLFEFGGDHLRRIDHLDVGTLQATNVVVEVPDRESGDPLRILNDVTLDIKTGEFIGILGGSGQGKSTLLNALCGISPGTSGSVTIGGVPVEELIKNRPGSIGYVPQDDIVHSELSVTQAFRYSARLRLPLPKSEREELIQRTIEVLGLTEHKSKRVHQLSGGQRKRVSIGIELLSKPDILFLDEPSSGLDPATEKSLMELLQALSLTNLTVVCTTHVLQNAFLFNRLLFVHGGKMIFAGSAGQAREYFLGSSATQTMTASLGVGRTAQSPLEKIYPTVLESTKPAVEWETEFENSRFFTPQKLIDGPPPEERSKIKSVGAFTKLRVLLQRQASILKSDWLNIAFLFSQAIIIGGLVAWVSDDLGFRMFLGIIAAMWFGCSNGAQQIVAELPIFKRERICGLGVNTYIFSKLGFQSALTAVQALLLFCVIIFGGKYLHPGEFDQESFLESLDERENPIIVDDSATGDVVDFLPVEDMGGDLEMPPSPDEIASSDEEPEEEERNTVPMTGLLTSTARIFDLRDNILDSGDKPLFDQDFRPDMDENKRQKVRPGVGVWHVVGTTLGLKVGAFLLVAVIGVGIGLVISALVRSTTQAVMWVPLVLIPQILFGGFVISMPEMTSNVRKVAKFFPSFAGQRLIDVSHLYGRRAPKITNKTKTPTFLTSDGEKEKVEWERDGKTISEDFEELSEVNTSWQNLSVHHDIIGHHEIARDEGYDGESGPERETVEERNDVKYRQGTVFRHLYPAGTAAGSLGIWLLISFIIMQIGLRRKG